MSYNRKEGSFPRQWFRKVEGEGNEQMNFFDAGLILLMILYVLWGVYRGFFRTLAAFFGSFVSFVLAVVFARIAASWLSETEFIRNLFFRDGEGFSFYAKIYSAMPEGLKEISRLEMRSALAGAENPVGALKDLISQHSFLLGLLASLFKGSLLEPLTSPEILNYSFDNLACGFSLLISGGLLVVFTGVFLFIALRIITFVLQLLMHDIKFGNILDRVLGGIMGLARTFCFTVILLMALSFVINFGFMNSVRKELYGENGRQSVIVRPIADWTFEITDKFVGFKDTKKIFDASDFAPES